MKESTINSLINKQFEICNISFVDVLKWSEKKEVPWYQHFTFNQEQYEQWKEHCLKIIKKDRLHKLRAEQVFAELDLMWGLKVI